MPFFESSERHRRRTPDINDTNNESRRRSVGRRRRRWRQRVNTTFILPNHRMRVQCTLHGNVCLGRLICYLYKRVFGTRVVVHPRRFWGLSVLFLLFFRDTHDIDVRYNPAVTAHAFGRRVHADSTSTRTHTRRAEAINLFLFFFISQKRIAPAPWCSWIFNRVPFTRIGTRARTNNAVL